MIVVGNSIISDDIAEQCFGCDLGCCKGACCVEGDSGAPLLESEVAVIEAVLGEVWAEMSPEGREAVERQGVAVRDSEGDLGTPLVEGGACAYAIRTAAGTLCAIERVYRQAPQESELKRRGFPKPVSCHLYPIRVEDYGEFTAVNYHQWDICRAARGQGEPLYRAMREPLVRRFGQEWYDELLQEIQNREHE